MTQYTRLVKVNKRSSVAMPTNSTHECKVSRLVGSIMADEIMYTK